MRISLRRPGSYEAFLVSWLSVVITVLATLVGIAVATRSGSSAILGFALENFVDTFSSLLLVWRFWGGGTSVSEYILELREKRASVGIAFAFCVLAFVVGGMALSHLAAHHETEDSASLLLLAAPSVVVFLVLGVLKAHIGAETDSPSMKKDAACTLCGAVLSLGVCVGVFLAKANAALWWTDAAVALMVSAGLLAHGVHTLAKNARQHNKWWTQQWWMLKGFVKLPDKLLRSLEAGVRPTEIFRNNAERAV